MFNRPAPSFPLYITVPIWCAALLLILIIARRKRDPCLTFLLLVLWLRYTTANLHEYTFAPVAAGLSIMALSSLAIVAAGCWVVGARALFQARLLPFQVMIWLTAVSTCVNQGWMGGVNVALKWLFLMVIAMAAYQVTLRHRPIGLFAPLTIVFAPPVILQWLSVAFGLDAPNYEGVKSYIGGYEHQQAFAIVILTFLFVTCSSVWLSGRAGLFSVLVAIAGLALANYRTAILAALLPCSVYLIFIALRRVTPRLRLLVVSVMGAALCATLLSVAFLAQERFADIGTVISKGTALIQSSDQFTFQEQRIFSGRPWIWSLYIESFAQGAFVNQLVGHGPDAWIGRFIYYAHNTFVSALYELGVLGVVAVSALLLHFWTMAARARGVHKWILLSFHFTFLFLNLGTLPFWTLEGSILFALLVSQTWWRAEQAARSPIATGPAPRHRAPGAGALSASSGRPNALV